MKDNLLDEKKPKYKEGWEPYFVARGINLSNVARGTGLSLSGVSRIFAGDRAPKLSTARLICNFLSSATGRKWGVDDLLDLIERKPWLKKGGAKMKKNDGLKGSPQRLESVRTIGR